MKPLATWIFVLIASVAACRGGCGSKDRAPVEPGEATRSGSGLLAPASLADGPDQHAAVVPPPNGPDEATVAANRARHQDPVIAWVNDEQIHLSELETRLQRRLSLQSGRRAEPDAAWRDRERQRIVRELVNEAALRQHFVELGINVSEEELDTHLAAEIERVFHSDEHFEQYLRRRHLTREQFRQSQRFDLELTRLLEQRGPIEASDAAVLAYYEQYRENWRAPERVLASTLTIRLPRQPSEEVVTAGRERIENLRELVTADPDNFETVAREHSQSPDRYRGGELGWVYRDDPDLEPAVAEALFGPDVGTVTAPVRTRLGWQIYVIRDHREEGYRQFDEVRDSLHDLVSQREELSRRAAVTLELLRRYEVGYNEEAYGLESE